MRLVIRRVTGSFIHAEAESLPAVHRIKDRALDGHLPGAVRKILHAIFQNVRDIIVREFPVVTLGQCGQVGRRYPSLQPLVF